MRGWGAFLLVLLLGARCVQAGPAVPSHTSRGGVRTQATDSSMVASTGPDTAAIETVATMLTRAPASAPPETVVTAALSSAPVIVGGKEVFRVFASRDGLDPVARVAAIRRRLNVAVADRAVRADSIRLVPTPQGVEVRLGPYFLWVVTPGDTRSRNPSQIATELLEFPARLRAGIEAERAGRTPVRLTITAVILLGLTLVTFVLSRLVLLAGRRWRAAVHRRLLPRLPGLRVREFEIVSQRQVAGLVVGILGRVDALALVVLLYGYVMAVLSRLPWTQGWSWQLLHWTSERAVLVLRTLVGAVPGLLAVVLVVLAFRWLVRISDRFFESVAAGRISVGGFHPELARPSQRLVRIALWIVAVVVAYPFMPGAHSKAVQGVSLLIGLMLSLGSSSFIGNMMAGLVLTYSRSFRIGDRVRFGEHLGDVVTLGYFATKIRSIRNEEITIPNSQILGGAIVNYTRLAEEPGLILHTQVTIGYDASWRQVHGLLIEAAGHVRGVEQLPTPWVYQRSLDDNYVTYELCCVTRDSHDQLRLYSDLHAEIQDAFSRAGVEILSPAYRNLRDANAPALPPEPPGPRPARGGFQVERVESK